MNFKPLFPLIAAMSFPLVGCQTDSTPPEVVSEADVNKQVESLSPQAQIDYLNRSPMPPAEKQKKIEEIKKKAGLSGASAPTGAPGATGG